MSLLPSPIAVDERGQRVGAVPLAVSAAGLTKRFAQREVVSNLSFDVDQGHAFGLLGPNGSGKTTTIRLLTGLLTPDGGSVRLFGETVDQSSADELRRRIGVQTDTSLYDTLSARENLRTWGALYGITQRALGARVDEILEILGLSERAASLVGEFSKGMRQKLAVGRAIMHKPDLLFLDEPTAGLDPEAAAELIDHLKGMIRALRTTVIICTHQLYGLESLCDDIGIIRQGELLAHGAVGELLHEMWPEQRYTLEVGGDPVHAQRVVAPLVDAEVVADGPAALAFSTPDGERVAEVVAQLVRGGVPVRSVIPTRRTVEQFYFATLDEEGRP